MQVSPDIMWKHLHGISFYSNRTKKGIIQGVLKSTMVETLSRQLQQAEV